EGELAERGEELKVASAEAAALERDLSRARASLTEAQTRASSLEAVVDDLRRETAEATAEVGRAEANWARARR
ncbi:MAG: Atg14 domain-containing protein, partial [Actinomycetota bacterium]|nr:Atg14 domain-containing protein [Actinomycetota bacterium]